MSDNHLSEKTTVPISLIIMIGSPVIAVALAFMALSVKVDTIFSRLQGISQEQIRQGDSIQKTQLDVGVLKNQQDQLKSDLTDIKSDVNTLRRDSQFILKK